MELKPDETGQAIVPVLACVLRQLCFKNDMLPTNKSVNKFHALRPPAISIRDYLMRIAKYAACSGECFVLALVYIDRIIKDNPTFVVNSLNIHRLLITSVMLAAKFFDDQYFNNAYYAKVGGVPCVEMNSLEVEFLFMTNFTLFVATEEYRQYYTELHNHAANSSCDCASTHVPELIIPELRPYQPRGMGMGREMKEEREGGIAYMSDSPGPSSRRASHTTRNPNSTTSSRNPYGAGSSSSAHLPGTATEESPGGSYQSMMKSYPRNSDEENIIVPVDESRDSTVFFTEEDEEATERERAMSTTTTGPAAMRITNNNSPRVIAQ